MTFSDQLAELLRQSPDELTVKEIATLTGRGRSHVASTLSKMKSDGLIEVAGVRRSIRKMVVKEMQFRMSQPVAPFFRKPVHRHT